MKRLPTDEERAALVMGCDLIKTGSALIFRSQENGNKIILPACGYKRSGNPKLQEAGIKGKYWTSDMDTYDLIWIIGFDRYDKMMTYTSLTTDYNSVRLVSTEPAEGFVDLGLSVYWADHNEDGLMTWHEAMKAYNHKKYLRLLKEQKIAMFKERVRQAVEKNKVDKV